MTADFNNDSKPDLAVANAFSSSLSVLLGNGTGSFNPAVNYTVPSTVYSVAAGDLNHDSRPDLASTSASTGTISVLLNTCGQPTPTVTPTAVACTVPSFGPATNYPVGTQPNSVSSADFNHDGAPDLATANNGSENVSILLNNGSGGFGTANNIQIGKGPLSVMAGDFNNDNNPDLAVSSTGGNGDIHVLLGNGTGGFGTPTPYPSGSTPYGDIRVADVNEDGNLDVLTANLGGTAYQSFWGTARAGSHRAQPSRRAMTRSP